MAKVRPKLSEPEATIAQLRRELLVVGFAVAKETATLRAMTSGTMKCPLCQQFLNFSLAQTNNHFAAKCVTPNCINMME